MVMPEVKITHTTGADKPVGYVNGVVSCIGKGGVCKW